MSKKIKIKVVRRSLKFEYEFEDETVVEVAYLAPTTKQINGSLSIKVNDGKGALESFEYTKKILLECLIADDGIAEKIIDEQSSNANIYEFRATLDEELGKLKKNV